MVWMFSDCWPTSNWSIIDYYRRPKPSYYAAKRACSPRLPIIAERGGWIEFFFGNDTLDQCAISVTYGLRSLCGDTVWKKTVDAVAAANMTHRIDAISRSGESFGMGQDSLPPVTYFPDGWREIEWAVPNIDLVRARDEQTEAGVWSERDPRRDRRVRPLLPLETARGPRWANILRQLLRPSRRR